MTYQEQQREIVQRLQDMFDQNRTPSSLVDLTDDYVNDPRLSLTILGFPSREVATKIKAFQKVLREADPRQHYFAQPALHITVRNIRVVADPPNFSMQDVQNICQVVRQVAKQFDPCACTYERGLVSPAGVSAVGITDADFGRLVCALRDGAAAAGVPDDKKLISEDVFFANTTFVRFTEPPNEAFLELARNFDFTQLGSTTIDFLSVVSTNAVLGPDFLTEYTRVPLGVDPGV